MRVTAYPCGLPIVYVFLKCEHVHILLDRQPMLGKDEASLQSKGDAEIDAARSALLRPMDQPGCAGGTARWSAR
jgi:hypothetical protein